MIDINSKALRVFEGVIGFVPSALLFPFALLGLVNDVGVHWRVDIKTNLLGLGGVLGTIGIGLMLTSLRRRILQAGIFQRLPIIVLLVAGLVSLLYIYFPYLYKYGMDVDELWQVVYIGPIIVGIWQLAILLIQKRSE